MIGVTRLTGVIRLRGGTRLTGVTVVVWQDIKGFSKAWHKRSQEYVYPGTIEARSMYILAQRASLT